jgi:thiamine biosynthesis lipoprotein
MHRVEHVMGMPIVVAVRGAAPRGVVDEVYDWFRWVDAVFSTYKHESEVNRIDRGELAREDAHPLLREVFDRCEELYAETRGYFDARAASPIAFDPTGLVKGWSVDRAAEILERAGVREYAVSAGGDMRVGDGLWRVGIQHPRERRAVARVFEASGLAVATSGEYARGRHVVDPHTGRSPDGLLSVTVTGPELGTADAYATAAFAMGAERGPGWTARLAGYDALTILADGRVLATPRFPAAA